MPRAGLDQASVVAAGAALADEVGFDKLTMGLLAERLGVRTPSLYKHVANQEDLNRRIAVLATSQAADAVGKAVQGYSGRDALAAGAHAYRDFILAHPGRYASAMGVTVQGPDDPLALEGQRLMNTFRAILRSYDVPAEESDHALRALRSVMHGFATIQAQNGFQWATDIDESFEWLIDFVDRGLRAR